MSQRIKQSAAQREKQCSAITGPRVMDVPIATGDATEPGASSGEAVERTVRSQ